MSNYASNENMEALMTAIGNKKDDKPISMSWSDYIALTTEERAGKHFVLSGAPGGGSSEQVQADWEQSDTTAPDYIKNKPSTTSSVTSGSTDLVTSGGVYSYVDTMITQALSGSY